METKKTKFFRIIDKAEDVCLVIMFAVMVAAIFLQVVMRFIFNNSLPWSEELGKFMFVWISWLGISIGQRRNEHIKITLLIDRFSEKWQKILELIANVLLFMILAVTLYYAVELVGFQSRVSYAGIKISTSWGYPSLVLGCSFMALRLIGGSVRNIKALRNGDLGESSAGADGPESSGRSDGAGGSKERRED